MSWKLAELEQQLLIGSTLIEGSTLSEAEAKDLLSGRTVSGHLIEDARDLLNYRAAVEWFIGQLERSPFLSVDLIQTFHRRLFQGRHGEFGSWKTHVNFTFLSDGTKHAYLDPHQVDPAMNTWVQKFNHGSAVSPETGATEHYFSFEQIHPFDDGNGRIGRVLIAYWLHWKWGNGFKLFVSDKIAHLEALEKAQRGDMSDLVAFFLKRLIDG